MNNNGDNRNNYLLFLQFFSMSSVDVSSATSRSAGWGGVGWGTGCVGGDCDVTPTGKVPRIVRPLESG